MLHYTKASRMEFVILIMRTLDWRNTTSLNNCCNSKRGWNIFLQRVKYWNKIFNISYFEYRARLKEITLKSFNATGIPVVECASYDEASKYLKANMNKNLIVLPTDDDDRYHPDIKTYLQPLFEDKSLPMVQWRGWLYDTKIKERFYDSNGWLDGKYVTGIEYAIRCDKTEGIIKDHAAYPNNVYRRTEEPLSVWVRHLASFWDNQRGNFELEPKFEKTPIPKELEWATEYIEMLRGIDLRKVKDEFINVWMPRRR